MGEQQFEQYWKEIVNTMNEGLIILSPDGTIQMINSTMEKLTGFSKDELIGKPCTVLNCDSCESARSESRGKWCLLFDLEQGTMKRCIIARKDGSYVPVLKKASILRDPQGTVLGAVETLTDLSDLNKMEQEIESLSRLLHPGIGFHGLVGKSAAMQKVFHIVEKAAQSDAPILIHGASGTGKELVARAIHEIGPRRAGPYIELHCAALNEALLESEFFGHVKGAFTGAYRHRQGRFEAAHGGDIFLDEIGDVPMSIQVKLLRVLETKQFERVGDHQPVCVDVRIITATNRNLTTLVSEKEFREDLFFRINVIPIFLPPLSARMEDIPLLTDHFIRALREKTGKDILGLSPDAMKLLMNYSWPGNVRELRSALEYAFVIAERGSIGPAHLPNTIAAQRRASCFQSESTETDSAEKEALIQALRESGGNKTQAARILGLSRVTVWNRMRKYGIALHKKIDS